MRYQKVKYKLINNDTERSIWLENDPKEWDNSNRTLKREKTFGIMTELSKNLVFVKDGYDFLEQAYILKGGEADVTLEEFRYHPKTSQPYLHSVGTFDFSKYKKSKLEIKVPFKTGGLNALIKSQQREKFELERLDSINGKDIEQIERKLVQLTSRKILLISKVETNENDAISKSFRMKFSDSNYRTGSLAVPTEISVNSDENLFYVARDTSFTTRPNEGSSSGTFYFNNDLLKTLKIDIDFFCKVNVNKIDDIKNGFLKVDLVIFENGGDLNLKTRTNLYTVPFNTVNQHVIDFNYSNNIVLQAGESLALQWYGGGNFGGGIFGNDGYLYLDFEQTKSIIDIEEDSKRADSQTYAYLLNDVGEKLMQIITGEKNRFYSSLLTNGDFSKLSITTGFLIRQFYDKNTQISLSQFLETLNAVLNTGYHIEMINGKETLVVEDLKFYFQQETVIYLDEQVTDLEYENAEDLCHSSLEFGYDDTGEYDEAMGLDEPNIKTGFTTPLKRVETKYSKISKAKAGTYPKEFARRKLKSDFGTTDTSYDKWLFLLDLKEGLGQTLLERTYQDDFDELPTGIFSPETITNLRLTPSQIEKRHQWFYGAGVFKHQEEKIRYSNTEGNNLLVTKEVGKPDRSERDDIEISYLQKPRFEAKYATFKHPLTYDIVQKLNGKTNINGREIPNVYFRMQFIDEDGKKQKGYLMQQSQKQPNLAEFKLLIAI